MLHRQSVLRSAAFAVLLLAGVAGCSSIGGETEPTEWGAEAVLYFDRLAEAYSRGDVYGILDFYTPAAEIEKWRGDNRGGWPIPDLIKWNSGDLALDVVSVYLGSEAALTLVGWPSSGDFGAVVSEFDRGRIRHEVNFDLGGSLERGFRAVPAMVASYEDLYVAFAEAWSSRNGEAIAGLYSQGASIDGAPMTGPPVSPDEATDESTGIRWESVGAPDLFGGSVAIDTPAVFLGPAEYGRDPRQAVGVYRVTDADGCEHRIAVRWIFEGGFIVEETRFRETVADGACGVPVPAVGWWSDLALPMPSDQTATGLVETRDGASIEVRNGTPALVDLFEWGLGRFAEGGLSPPSIDTVTFEPSRSCAGLSGRVLDDGSLRNLYVCIYDSDFCAGAGPCSSPGSSARIAVLHELAHAWMLDNVDDETVDAVLYLSDRTTWDDPGVPWSDRGVEYSAEVIAWGLIEEAPAMVRIGAPPCTELAAVFTLLTGAEPALDRCS